MLRALGAGWFAVIACIGFPLSIVALPGPSSFSPNSSWLLSGVWAGVTAYGLPAALAGAITSTRIYRSSSLGAFIFGALTVVLTCLFSGLWMTILNARVFNLRVIAEQAFVSGMGAIVIDVFFLRGVPFVLGGFAALAFRAVLFKFYEDRDDR
jgi:hypothetical protein